MYSRVSWLWRGAPFILAALLLTLMAAACGDDDRGASADEIAEVEETTKQAFESSGDEAEFFFAHVTDNLIQTVLLAPSREECEAAAHECIGEPSMVESISGTEIDGDNATMTVVSDFGTYEVGAVREDGVWKVDYLQAASDEVPDGTASVDLGLSEFNFLFDAVDIPADGNFAFHATNFGTQVHEVVLVGVPEGASLEEAVEAVAAEEVPPLAFKVFIQPGQDVDIAFEAPLDPGNYALVCFLPDTTDPEFAAHIEKGMFAEFSVE